MDLASSYLQSSTVGADASVEALKLYDIKLLTLAYLALLSNLALDLYVCKKWEMINRVAA